MQISIRMRIVAGLAIGVALSVPTTQGQKTGGPPTTGNPGVGRLPPNLNGQTTGPVAGSINGSIYLSGNVMLDDGTPPPDPVTIERVCSGSPRAQAYTDRKGRFSFQIGQTSGVTQDASEEGANISTMNRSAASMGTGIGPAQPPQTPLASSLQMANCDLRAVLAGFRSDTVNLGGRRLLDDPNVGTLVLHRLADVEGSSISVTSLRAPKEARSDYNKALQALRKDKRAEALKELQKAVNVYPEYAAAWYDLGSLEFEAGDNARAQVSLSKAVAADPKYINPYLKLTELAAQAEQWGELADYTSRLLRLDAVDYPMAYFYNATANLNLGHLEDAEKSGRAGIKLDAAHHYPKLEQLLGMIYVRKRDYAAAAAQYRSYIALAPDATDIARMKKQVEELERLTGDNERAAAAKK